MGNAVLEGRKMLGATKPADSALGTIRGDFCIDVGRNLCHGSDAVESAEKEIALWFPEGLQTWEDHSNAWVYGKRMCMHINVIWCLMYDIVCMHVSCTCNRKLTCDIH